jgi:hypothetical protein
MPVKISSSTCPGEGEDEGSTKGSLSSIQDHGVLWVQKLETVREDAGKEDKCQGGGRGRREEEGGGKREEGG